MQEHTGYSTTRDGDFLTIQYLSDSVAVCIHVQANIGPAIIIQCMSLSMLMSNYMSM